MASQPPLERSGSLRSVGSFDEDHSSIEAIIGASKQLRSRITELGKVITSLPDLAQAASIQAELEYIKPGLAKLAKCKTTDVKIRAGGEEHRLRDSQAALNTMCEQVAEATNQNWGRDKIPRKLELDPEGCIFKLDKDLELLRRSVTNVSPNERQSMFREFVANDVPRGPWHSALMAIVFFGAPSLMAIAHRLEAATSRHMKKDSTIIPHNLFNAFEVLALGSSLIDELVAASPDKENLGVRFLIDSLISDTRILIDETSTSATTATEMSLAQMTEDSPTKDKPRPPWSKVKEKQTTAAPNSNSTLNKSAPPPPPPSTSTKDKVTKVSAPPPVAVAEETPSPWTKCESRSHKGKYYWFNTLTGKSQWKPPKDYKDTPKSPKSETAKEKIDGESEKEAKKEGKHRANTPQRRVTEGDAPSVIAIDNSAKRQSASKKQVGLTGKGLVLGTTSGRRNSIGANQALKVNMGSASQGAEDGNENKDDKNLPSPRQLNGTTTGPMIARFTSRAGSASFSEGEGSGKKRSVSPMIARRLAAWKSASITEEGDEKSDKGTEAKEKPPISTGAVAAAAKKFPSSGFASAVGSLKRSNSAPARKLDAQTTDPTTSAPSYVQSLQSTTNQKSVPARKLSASLRSASPIADRVNMWKKKAQGNLAAPPTKEKVVKDKVEKEPVQEKEPEIPKQVVAEKETVAPAPKERGREASPAPRREPSPSRTRKVQRAVPTIPAQKSSSEHIAMPSDDAAATVKHTVRKPSPSRGQAPPNFGFSETPSSLSSIGSSIGSGGTFSPKSGFSLSTVPPAPARSKQTDDTGTVEKNGDEEERGRSTAAVPLRKTSYRSSSPMAERLALWKSKTESQTNPAPGPGKMKRSSSAGAAAFGRRGGEGGSVASGNAIADRVNQWKRMASTDNADKADQRTENEVTPSSDTAQPTASSESTEVSQDATNPPKQPERESTPTRARGRDPSPIADRLRKWKVASHAVGVPSYLAQRVTTTKSDNANSYIASLQNKSVNARAGSAPPRSPGNRVKEQTDTSTEAPATSDANIASSATPSQEIDPAEKVASSSVAEASRRFGRLGLTSSSSTSNSTYSPSSGDSAKPRQQRSMSPLIANRMKAWQNKALHSE